MRPFNVDIHPSPAPKRRLARLLTASLAAGVALTCLVPFASSELPTAAAADQFVKNGTFTTSIEGWRSNSLDQLRRHTPNGRIGGAAELSVKSGHGNVVLNDAKPTVGSAQAGAKYTVSAWVRAAKPGVGGHLRVRAVSLQKTEKHQQYFYLDDSKWTKVSFTFTNKQEGASFDLNVLGYDLASNNELLVDDVTLAKGDKYSGQELPPVNPEKPQPEIGGYLTGSGTYSKTGLPSKGAYFGAAVGGNTDPAAFEKDTGGKLGIRRTFYGPSNVNTAVKIAAGDIANDRLPWISFKLPYSWQDMADGKGDAWAKDLVSKLDGLNGPVWLAFHHEPEGDAAIGDWVAMQKHLSPIVKKNSDNVAFTTILTGWHQLYGNSKYSLENTWPGDGVVDVVGFDVYNSHDVVKNGKTMKATDMDASYFKHFAAFAKKHNVDWALAETGINDPAAKKDPEWMERTYKQLVKRGGVGMTYFNTPLNSITSWAITNSVKTNQFAEVLKSSSKMK